MGLSRRSVSCLLCLCYDCSFVCSTMLIVHFCLFVRFCCVFLWDCPEDQFLVCCVCVMIVPLCVFLQWCLFIFVCLYFLLCVP